MGDLLIEEKARSYLDRPLRLLVFVIV